MMYIRTKDGVYEELDTTEQGVWTIYGNFIENNEILNQSDTIEELCDEFCYIKDGVVSQYLTIDFKFKRDDEFCALKNKLTANGIAEISKGISKYELQVGELKCAIYTDKGLIYVAKMDNEGKLVLI